MIVSTAEHDADAVRAALLDELGQGRERITGLAARLTPEADRLVDFARGGKLLRSQFLCWGYRSAATTTATGGDDDPLPIAVARAGAALELIQACALLHDDLIDRSDTRRGRPSVHRAVAKAHADAGWAGDAEHYGFSVALLLGDLALAWADDLLVDACLELAAAERALPVWRAMRTEVLAGQLLDVRVTADLTGDAALQERDAMEVNRLKTAAYTVGRPLELGAQLAGAGAGAIAALTGYGAAIGLAFQLRDDQLGIFGDPAVTGKPAGGDLIEGKRTVLLARARAGLPAADRAELDAGIGRAASASTVARLTDLVAGSGASEQVSELIEALVTEGCTAVSALDDCGRPLVAQPVSEALVRLARRSMRRNS